MSRISLAARRLHCCVAFFSFRSSKLETLYLLNCRWIFRYLATCISNHCSKILFIVFTLTWETRAGKKYTFYLSVSLVLFWCSEKPPTFVSNLKDVTGLLLQDKQRFPSPALLVDNMGAVLVHLLKFLRDLQLHSCVELSSQLQYAWVLTC